MVDGGCNVYRYAYIRDITTTHFAKDRTMDYQEAQNASVTLQEAQLELAKHNYRSWEHNGDLVCEFEGSTALEVVATFDEDGLLSGG